MSETFHKVAKLADARLDKMRGAFEKYSPTSFRKRLSRYLKQRMSEFCQSILFCDPSKLDVFLQDDFPELFIKYGKQYLLLNKLMTGMLKNNILKIEAIPLWGGVLQHTMSGQKVIFTNKNYKQFSKHLQDKLKKLTTISEKAYQQKTKMVRSWSLDSLSPSAEEKKEEMDFETHFSDLIINMGSMTKRNKDEGGKKREILTDKKKSDSTGDDIESWMKQGRRSQEDLNKQGKFEASRLKLRKTRRKTSLSKRRSMNIRPIIPVIPTPFFKPRVKKQSSGQSSKYRRMKI